MKKVALVTGASAGLGVEFARELSKRGHSIVLVARRKERLEELAAELGNARALALDLSKANAAPKLMADIEANGEVVDLLVNNAGFGLIGPFAELDAKLERQMIDLNVGTLTDLCRAVAPTMIKRTSGGIINVASTAAFQPGPKMAVYFATKAFVLVPNRSAPRGVEASWHQGYLPLPRPNENGVRRCCRLQRQRDVRQNCDERRRGGRSGSRRPRFQSSGGRRGMDEQGHGGEHPVCAALGGSQNRRCDQILTRASEPARRSHRCAIGMSAGQEK